MKKTDYHRRQQIKNLLVFQFKLVCDAGRDFALSPIAFGCVAFDILFGVSQEKSLFQRLLKFGALSDRWINLFEDHEPLDDPSLRNADHWADKMDRKLRKKT